MWGQVAAVSVLPVLALCFSHQDNELFRLNDKIANDLGTGTNFYSWLGLKKGARSSDIVRAYRKLSKQLHPDRNPGVEATERFARLNQVYKTLTSPLRDRYDYYLSVGFPKYNPESDDWMYRRYRPGIFFVVVLLALIYTGVQFLVLKTSALRQRQYINNLIEEVRAEVAKGSQNGAITSISRVSRGSQVFVVHPTGEVYFEGTQLSADLVDEPTWKDTHAGKLINKFMNKEEIESQTAPSSVGSQDQVSSEDSEDNKEESGSSTSKKDAPVLKKGAAKRRTPGARGKAKIF